MKRNPETVAKNRVLGNQAFTDWCFRRITLVLVRDWERKLYPFSFRRKYWELSDLFDDLHPALYYLAAARVSKQQTIPWSINQEIYKRRARVYFRMFGKERANPRPHAHKKP